MNRLTTSRLIEIKIIDLQHAFKMSTKAAVMRLAIGVSLKKPSDPRKNMKPEELENNGANYLISTITGEYEELYKMLLSRHLNSILNDSQFTNLIKAHVSRGINYLSSEYQLNGSGDKVISKIINSL